MDSETRAGPGRHGPRGPGGAAALRAGLLGRVGPLLLCSCALPWSRGEAPLVVFPGPPAPPRIQLLESGLLRSAQPPGGALRRFLGVDNPPRENSKPYGLALHGGELLVCDTRRGVVDVLDLEEDSLTQLGGRGSRGRLRKPINIAVDRDGTRYVTDTELEVVMVYDRRNRYLRALGRPGRWLPVDVAVAAERLYVTDLRNGQVVVLAKATGAEIERFGRPGSGEGELSSPTGLELDADGNLYVADTGNHRVLEWDPEGRLVRQLGSVGAGLVRPKGVAVDHEGRLYVVDAARENIRVFEPTGELLLMFGGPGDQPGALNLPAQVEIDYEHVGLLADRVAPGYEVDYLILVTSQLGPQRVNAFGFLRPERLH